jgi:hypothetical protein
MVVIGDSFSGKKQKAIDSSDGTGESVWIQSTGLMLFFVLRV